MSLSPYVKYVDPDDGQPVRGHEDNRACTVQLGNMPGCGAPRPAKVDSIKWARSFDRKCDNAQRTAEKTKRKEKRRA